MSDSLKKKESNIFENSEVKDNVSLSQVQGQ